MTRGYQSLLMGLVALLLLRLSLTGDFLNYVKPVMRPFLIIAGVVLALVALALVLTERSGTDHGADADPHDGDHDEPSPSTEVAGHHDDHGPPRLAWLLIIPLAAAFVVAPGSLGSYAASRGGSWTPPTPVASGWPPPLLSPVEGAHDIGLYDFSSRAFFDEAQGLADKPLRMVGFVRSSEAVDGFMITRFFVACCAADGVPISVQVVGFDGARPPDDVWVEVEGTWLPNATDLDWNADNDTDWATLVATSVTEIPEPREPYES